MAPGKRSKFYHPTSQKSTTPFHGFEFMADPSWIPQGFTREAASAMIQKSVSHHTPYPEVPFVWVDDLVAERGRKDPLFDISPKRKTNGAQDRGCNSFMQYRMYAQRAFSGQQTKVSKNVEQLWSTESDQMKFQCERAAEIESLLKTNICTPPIDCSFSAHPEIRALASILSGERPLPMPENSRKSKKQARRLSRQSSSKKNDMTPAPSSPVKTPDTDFDGDLDTTTDSPTPEHDDTMLPVASQASPHSSSFHHDRFYESQEIPETELLKFISSDMDLFVDNKFLPSWSTSAVAAGSSPDLADCEDLGLDWDTPPGSFDSLSPLFEGEDLDFGFSDPIW